MNKNRLFSAILSIMLSIVMVAGIFPAINPVSEAVTIRAGITIVDIDTPRPGVAPDYNATYGTGCTSTTQFDAQSEFSKNGVSWSRKVNANQSVYLNKRNSLFFEGSTYTVAIVIKAAEGYKFKTDGISPDVNVTINGNKAKVSGITGYNISEILVVSYTFDACEYKEIPNVFITGLNIPQMDDTPDFEALPHSDTYTVSMVGWHDDTANKPMTATDKFIANHEYTVEVFVQANPGTKLKTDDDDCPAFAAKINGTAAEPIYAVTNGGKAAGLKISYTVSPVITNINVSSIEIPEAGKAPDFSCTVDSDAYEIADISWEGQFGSYNDLQESDTFEAGKTYRLLICLRAKDGFTFKTSNGDVVATAKINGDTAQVNKDASSNLYCEILYYYTIPQDITSVSVTDIAVPFAGGTADMLGTVTGTGYRIANIEWFDSTDGYGNYISNITSFSEGREYTVDIYLETTGIYKFNLDPDYPIPDISASINGKYAKVYSMGNEDEAIISFKYKTPVEVITVTGIDAPVAGNTPDMTAVSTKAGYEIHSVEWYDTTSSPYTKLSATDKFAAGHKYDVNITLYAVNDYIFYVDDDGYQDVSATINGNTAIVYAPPADQEYGTAIIGFNYTIPASHTHTPSAWKSDANGHWKECTDASCKAVTNEKSAHKDADFDEKCDTCAYPMPLPAELILKKGCTYTVDHTAKIVYVPENTSPADVKASIENKYFTLLNFKGVAPDSDKYIGSDSKIQITNKASKLISEYVIVVKYDADGNGETSSADARLALRQAVGLESLGKAFLLAADINNDAVVDSSDARSILRHSVGLSD